MSSKDQLQRFLFQDLDIRGELVGMHASYQQAVQEHEYPEPVQRLLGELMAAVVLLSATLKFEGSLSIQAHGNGELSFAMAECRMNRKLRAVARYQHTPTATDFSELVGRGQLVIAITPENGQRYQGVVPMESDSLAGCIEDYFAQSEQLPTRVWLSAEPGQQAAGLILQKLPEQQVDHFLDEDGWNRISVLANTLRPNELLLLDNELLLQRLFIEENLRLFPATKLDYECTCNRGRVLRSLATLSRAETNDLFEEQSLIEVKCEFCNRKYSIEAAEFADYLRQEEPATDTRPPTLH